MIDNPLLAVEETELEDEAIDEIGRRTHLVGNVVVSLLLEETLDGRLQRASLRGQIDVTPKQISTLVDDIDRLPRGVLVVLVGEERQVIEIVVYESPVEGYRTAPPHNHVLVHPALFDAASPAAPDAQEQERVTATVANPAAEEYVLALQVHPDAAVGVNLKRKPIFLGRWIRHGGRYPLLLLRIWRRGRGRIEERWMDEHMIVWGGRTVTFDGGFVDHNLNDLTFFTDKHNKYATREAIDVINQRRNLFRRDIDLPAQGSSLQAAVKRFFKEKAYNHIPYQMSAPAYFVYRLIFQLGFLDGKEGIVYHGLQGLWYRFLVGAKVQELELAIAGLDDPAEIRAELRRRTGLAIDP